METEVPVSHGDSTVSRPDHDSHALADEGRWPQFARGGRDGRSRLRQRRD